MKKILLFALLGTVGAANLGCKSDGPTASDDKAVRAGFAKKTFDINDVPPNERARVQGFMDRAKQMGAKGKPPTGKD